MKIYITDITGTSIRRLSGLVSDARITKSLQYRHEADQLRSLAAEALLNHAVKENFAQQKVPVMPTIDRYQKPHLGFTQFSLSHSGNYAACAISRNPVGIDVEHVREFRPAIAKRFFTPAEADACTDANAFTVCWTLKESFLKAVGYGIRLPMDLFEICPLSFSVSRGGSAVYEFIHSVSRDHYFGITYVINDQNFLSVCSKENQDFPSEVEWIHL